MKDAFPTRNPLERIRALPTSIFSPSRQATTQELRSHLLGLRGPSA